MIRVMTRLDPTNEKTKTGAHKKTNGLNMGWIKYGLDYTKYSWLPNKARLNMGWITLDMVGCHIRLD